MANHKLDQQCLDLKVGAYPEIKVMKCCLHCKPERAKRVGEVPFTFLKYVTATATSATKLAKCCALIITSYNTRFMYYPNITFAGILQIYIFILYQALCVKYA